MLWRGDHKKQFYRRSIAVGIISCHKLWKCNITSKMAVFYQFCGAFFTNWFLYMTAGPFLLDEIFKRICPKYRDKLSKYSSIRLRRRIEIAIILAGVFYAGFAAFSDEHTQREAAESALQTALTHPAPIPITETDTEARNRIRVIEKQIAKHGSIIKDFASLPLSDPHKRNSYWNDDGAIRASAPERWPALTDAQIAQWVKDLKPFAKHSITVYSDLDVRALFNSLKTVGERLSWDVPHGKRGK